MVRIELNMGMPENCMECRFHKVEGGLFDTCIITGCLFIGKEDQHRNENSPLKMEVEE